jgi:signal transduction histidine kinase
VSGRLFLPVVPRLPALRGGRCALKLRGKIAAATLAVVLLFAASGYASSRIARRQIRESLVRGTATLAAQIMGSVNASLRVELAHLNVMSHDPGIQRELAAANERFAAWPDIEARIQRVERQWRSPSPTTILPFMHQISSNALSRELRTRQSAEGERLYGEVFVTNRYGTTAAQTTVTSDYYQADELWWQEARDAGVYVDELVYDESAAVLGVPVALRVDDGEGEFLGVMKAVLTPYGLLEPLAAAGILPWEEDTELALLGPDGTDVYTARRPGGDGDDVETPPVPPPSDMRELPGYGPGLEVRYGLIGAEGLVVSVRGEHEGRTPGYRGQPGWTLLMTRNLRQALMPLDRLEREILLISLAVAGLALAVGMGVGARMAGALSPINAAVEELGRGNLQARAPVASRDEIGALAAGFNAMAASLEQTTASRDALEREMAERRRAEEQLEVYARRLEGLNAELKRSNRDLQEFTYSVSHDLQEPLRKIHTFGGFLQQDCGEALPEQGREHLEHMQAAALRMKALIQHLLDLARVGTRGGALAPVHAGSVAAQVLDTLSERIGECGADVSVRGELPTVQADEVQLARVLQNLVANALKFRSPQRHAAVRIGAETGDGMATFHVADNGIGIPEEHLEDIFGIFRRLHGRDEYEGAGMGLALCAKIIRRHGGRIWAESAPGEGATFRFTIPLADEGGRERNDG